MRVNGRRATIVGVGPKQFFGVFPTPNPSDIFVPIMADASVAPELGDDLLHRTGKPGITVLLRLQPGVSRARAEGELDAQTRQWRSPSERNKKTRLVRLIDAGATMPIPAEGRVMILTFYGFLVALIVSVMCANLAGLILARGSARSKEIAIRLSVGAGRWRLIRQLLTESLILAVLGGAGGFAGTALLLRLVISRFQIGPPPPPGLEWYPDFRVAVLVFVISSLAGIGFGLMPALAVTRPDLAAALKTNIVVAFGRHRRFGLRNLFVVYQVAAATALVLIMTYVLVGLRFGMARQPQFDTAPLAVFSIDPARDGLTPEQSAEMFIGLREALARTGGVESAALSSQLLLTEAIPTSSVAVPSAGAASPESVHMAVVETVGPGFFATLGATVIAGSEFNERDLRSDPAPGALLPAVLNQTAARELFGNANPLGRRIRQGGNTLQVAGVVRYDMPVFFRNAPVATMFLPMTLKDLRYAPSRGVTVVVRSRQLDEKRLRQALAAIDPRLTLFDLKTVRQYLAETDISARVASAIYLPFGLFGLVLASLGLAGVTAQAVQQRRKEIGIRMALGARREQLLALMMRQGVVMVSIGGVLGWAAAYGLHRVMVATSAPMAQFLHRDSASPVMTFGVPALLILVAVVACYLPARRTSTIDPLLALREE